MIAAAKTVSKAVGAFVGSPAAFVVRAGRVAYIGSAGLLTVAAYTAWRNQKGDETFFESLRDLSLVPGKASKNIGRSVSSLGAGANAAVDSVGSGLSGPETFSAERYQKRFDAMAQVARAFNGAITSAMRTEEANRLAGGAENSKHLKRMGALAFDFSAASGAITEQDREFYKWASSRTDVFQFVLLEWDHVHVEFRPGVTGLGTVGRAPYGGHLTGV